jgi:Uma2 family endonuclease
MSTLVDEEQLEYIPMSLDEFHALPEGVHGEYLDGTAIVAPPANFWHQRVTARLVVLFDASLTDVYVANEAGIRTIRDGHRIPDVVVVRSGEDAYWLTQPPLIAVEVSSPATHQEDTQRKKPEYGQAGVRQYWIVDRKHRTLTVHTYHDGKPITLITLDDAHPLGAVEVPGHGTITIDLTKLRSQ